MFGMMEMLGIDGRGRERESATKSSLSLAADHKRANREGGTSGRFHLAS